MSGEVQSNIYIYISIPGLACGDCGPDPEVDFRGFGGSASSLKPEGAPLFDCRGKLKIYGSIVPLRFQTSRSSHPSVKSLGVPMGSPNEPRSPAAGHFSDPVGRKMVKVKLNGSSSEITQSWQKTITLGPPKVQQLSSHQQPTEK